MIIQMGNTEKQQNTVVWSDKQLRAIKSRGENLLVSAAAGSGKTAVLAERVRTLVDECADLDRMLIITFTNAAAAEMRQRILRRVEHDLFTRTHISTFSKLSIEIYKQYYHVIDAPPGLAICDEYKEHMYKNEVLDEMFEDLFEADDAEFKEFLRHYCSPKNNEAARDMIKDLHRFIQSMPDPEAWLDKLGSGGFIDPERMYEEASGAVKERLQLALEDLRSAARILTSPPVDGVAPMPVLAGKLSSYTGAVEAALAQLESGAKDAVKQVPELARLSPERMAATKAEKAGYELVKDKVTALRNEAKTLVKKAADLANGLSPEAINGEKELLTVQLGRLCRLTKEFIRRYSKKKLDNGLMDFSDAEHFALRILDDPDVREEFRAAYDYIFVDEYQDSNLVQEELVNRLSRGNNVFMVGDIKQSIYKFRLAEPEIFLNKYKAYRSGQAPDSALIDLNMNYRSKKPVIDCINRIFEDLMTEQTVGLEYDEASRLHAGDTYEGPFLYDPELYIVSSATEDAEEKAAGDGAAQEIVKLKDAELEALNAARILKEYHGKTIDKKGVEAPLKWSDMAVLLRSAKNRAETYYKTFMEMGIPAYLERGEGYFDTPEIQVFLNLLRVTDNPRQDVPLISVMHFPSFGFTAAELAEIRIASKGNKELKAYYDALMAFAQGRTCEGQEALRNKSKAFLERLAAWRRKAAALPLADFIWELLSESGIMEFASALPNGRQREANLRSMTDRADTFEQESAGGIGDFVSYIELLASREQGIETGQASVISEADDVVRIQTIHKSKGLEYPFVLVAGMGTRLGGNSGSPAMKLHKNLGGSLKLKDPDSGVTATPLSYKLIEMQQAREELAEEIRVLYVALTRAKDILVMSGVTSKPEEHLGRAISSSERFTKFLNMVSPCMPARSMKTVTREELVRPEDSGGAAEIRRGIRSGFAVDEEKLPITVEELRERLSFDFSPDPEQLLKKKYSVSEIAEISRPELHQPAGQPQKTAQPRRRVVRSGLDAVAKGNAYHKVMQHIPFTAEGKSAEEILRFMEGLRDRNILSEEELKAVDPGRIEAFFLSELGQRAVASPELHREAPFILRTQFEGRSVVVQGVIDCYFSEGDHYVLIDYKSGYMDPDDPEEIKALLRERYAVQLRLYKEALETLAEKKVSGSYLYLFGLNDWISS